MEEVDLKVFQAFTQDETKYDEVQECRNAKSASLYYYQAFWFKEGRLVAFHDDQGRRWLTS